jgi:hypothetical protein
MGAKGGSQTVTQRPDPLTQQMQGQLYGAALAAAGLGNTSGTGQQYITIMGQKIPVPNSGFGSAINGPAAAPLPGINPLTKEANGIYQNAAGMTNLGLGALSGDQASIAKLMNPYNQNVIDAMTNNWKNLAAQTTNALNDQATQAGAFGGTRQGVAQGIALAQLNQDQANQMAALQSQGYSDAINQAGSLANLGLGAAGQLAQAGDYARQVQISQDPAMQRLQILQSALSGTPYGMSTTQPVNRNVAAGVLGGALTGARIGNLFPGAGTAIGAGLGGLLGLF